MEPALLGLVLDSSIIIEAERKHQTVEEFLTGIRQRFGEIEIAITAVSAAELVHGVERANTPEIRHRRRAFVDELKKHVPIHPVTDETGEVASTLSGSQAAKGITLPIDDLADPQTWDGYAYVRNNPLALTDPTGADTCADGSYADACVTAQPTPINLESTCWWCFTYGITLATNQSSPTLPQSSINGNQTLLNNFVCDACKGRDDQ